MQEQQRLQEIPGYWKCMDALLILKISFSLGNKTLFFFFLGNEIILINFRFNREDYIRYHERRQALAGIVQAFLITKHMLFIGTPSIYAIFLFFVFCLPVAFVILPFL